MIRNVLNASSVFLFVLKYLCKWTWTALVIGKYFFNLKIWQADIWHWLNYLLLQNVWKAGVIDAKGGG